MKEYAITNVWIRSVWNSNLDNEEMSSGFTLAWSADKIGFGEISFSYDHVAHLWKAETETMSRDFVKAVLAKLGDSYLEGKE